MGRNPGSRARRGTGRPLRHRHQPGPPRRTTPRARLPKLQAAIGDADEIVDLLALAAIVVTPTETVAIARDPDDDRLIEAAQAGQADVIVTGDQDLLALGRVGQISILTPREFLAVQQPGI
jgi:predicted nucleic acid-binding protein